MKQYGVLGTGIVLRQQQSTLVLDTSRFSTGWTDKGHSLAQQNQNPLQNIQEFYYEGLFEKYCNVENRESHTDIYLLHCFSFYFTINKTGNSTVSTELIEACPFFLKRMHTYGSLCNLLALKCVEKDAQLS